MQITHTQHDLYGILKYI